MLHSPPSQRGGGTARHWPSRRLLGSEKWGAKWMLHSGCREGPLATIPRILSERTYYMQVYISVAVTDNTLKGTSLLAHLTDRSPSFRCLRTSSVGRGWGRGLSSYKYCRSKSCRVSAQNLETRASSFIWTFLLFKHSGSAHLQLGSRIALHVLPALRLSELLIQ